MAVANPSLVLSDVAAEARSPLLRLHDSILNDIFARAGIRSRCLASCACKRLRAVILSHPVAVLDVSDSDNHPEVLRGYIEKAKSAITSITTSRHQERTARDAASARRFSSGLRSTQMVPYTAHTPLARRLAACLTGLRSLVLHEATSGLGGMTDAFAAALADAWRRSSSAAAPAAAAAAAAPGGSSSDGSSTSAAAAAAAATAGGLTHLEVAFTRYSLPSEAFSDVGMMALAESCPRLARLRLTRCGAVTNRSLYAVAAACRGLRELALGGYHELITDHGTVVLFQACTALERVWLSGKLRRVTDESAEALAAGAGAAGCLREVRLTRGMGGRALAALGQQAGGLRLVDCSKCEPGAITAAAVASMMAGVAARAAAAAAAAEAAAGGCSSSSGSSSGCELRVLLPPGVSAAEVVAAGSSSSDGAGGGGRAGLLEASRWRVVLPPPPAATAATAAAATATTAAAAACAAPASGGSGGSYLVPSRPPGPGSPDPKHTRPAGEEVVLVLSPPQSAAAAAAATAAAAVAGAAAAAGAAARGAPRRRRQSCGPMAGGRDVGAGAALQPCT